MTRTALADEVRNVQNPALGAALLWRFTCGYTSAHPSGGHVPLHLLFLVLPLTLHRQTFHFLSQTRTATGMRAFAAKFAEHKNAKQDLLLAIHQRTATLRSLTLDSLRIAARSRLVMVRPNATVMPLSQTETTAGTTDLTRPLLSGATKLGVWCADLSLHEIATILKIRF
jgi:Family of unknown function (DUF6521)